MKVIDLKRVLDSMSDDEDVDFTQIHKIERDKSQLHDIIVQSYIKLTFNYDKIPIPSIIDPELVSTVVFDNDIQTLDDFLDYLKDAGYLDFLIPDTVNLTIEK